MGIGIWLWSVANNTIIPDWESWSFDHKDATVAGYVKDRVNTLLLLAPPAPKTATTETKAPRPEPRIVLPVNAVVGRLEIPRLGVKTMVREGTEEKTLFSSLGHIPGTALPGEKGNVGVAGHRDTFFRSLAGIRTKDVMHFETTNGTYTYEVVSTTIVKPKDVAVLRSGASPEITLVTCYPFGYVGNAPDRFIVKARQLSVSAATVEPKATPAALVTPTSAEPIQKKVYEPAIASRTVTFSLIKNHTQILAPGILMGVSDIDPEHERFTVWLWMKSTGRTTWLHDHHAGDPIVFYDEPSGGRYQLTVSKVLDGIVSAQVLLPESQNASTLAFSRSESKARLQSRAR